VAGTDSELCPVAGFGISCSGSTTRESVLLKRILIGITTTINILLLVGRQLI
jgi:hypothetical protein